MLPESEDNVKGNPFVTSSEYPIKLNPATSARDAISRSFFEETAGVTSFEERNGERTGERGCMRLVIGWRMVSRNAGVMVG